MSEPEKVVSFAERLKKRREELGISQSQAARELDVARTAYRLWEMEAAKPAPDRWRLIASWLGITTMLLADELVSADESAFGGLAGAFGGVAGADLASFGRDQDLPGALRSGDFFAQARWLIENGSRSGEITAEQAAALASVLERVERESQLATTEGWAPAELRRTLPAATDSPRSARDALAFVAQDIPPEALDTARLLISELVGNSVRHGPRGPRATIEIAIQVGRKRLRVDVADRSATPARPKPPSDEGGYGLALVTATATRWGAGLRDGRNVTWFELDLPLPGGSDD